MKKLLSVTAFIELAAGVALVVWPVETVDALLGPGMLPPTLALVRLAGALPLALGVVSGIAIRSGQSRFARGVTIGMTVYNSIVVAGLCTLGLGLSVGGFLLWPAVVLHTAMAAWCIWRLKGSKLGG